MPTITKYLYRKLILQGALLIRSSISGFEMNKASLLRKMIVSPSSAKHTASLIFLHGSGDTGPGVKAWVDHVLGKEFNFPHIKVIFPSASPRPYSLFGGMLSTVWLDRSDLHPDTEECSEDIIKSSADSVIEIIEDEAKVGIADDRIIVGGFSQGGCLSFYIAYKYRKSLKGAFALSSYLGTQSCVYESLKQNSEPVPPLFQAHGIEDSLVLYDWGKATSDKLLELGVKGEFHTYPQLEHEPNKEELTLLKDWILKLLPP